MQCVDQLLVKNREKTSNQLTWSKSAAIRNLLRVVVKAMRAPALQPWSLVTLPPNLRPGVDGPSKVKNLLSFW